MDKKDFFEFGKIKKFNRKTGELSIRANSDDAEEYSNSPLIFIEVDGGLVPFYVSSVKLRDSKTIQLLLEDYASPENVRQFVDCPVWLLKIDKKNLNNDEFYFDEIIGYEVID